MQRSFSDAILAEAYGKLAAGRANDSDRLLIYIHETIGTKLCGNGSKTQQVLVQVKQGFPWAAAGAVLAFVASLLK